MASWFRHGPHDTKRFPTCQQGGPETILTCPVACSAWLARRAGLSLQAVKNLRNGEIRDYQDRLTVPVCRELGWSSDSIGRLLRGEDPIILPGRADPAEAAELPELVVEMSRQLAELTERVQELGAEVMRWHREGARAAPGSAAGSS